MKIEHVTKQISEEVSIVGEQELEESVMRSFQSKNIAKSNEKLSLSISQPIEYKNMLSQDEKIEQQDPVSPVLSHLSQSRLKNQPINKEKKSNGDSFEGLASDKQIIDSTFGNFHRSTGLAYLNQYQVPQGMISSLPNRNSAKSKKQSQIAMKRGTYIQGEQFSKNSNRQNTILNLKQTPMQQSHKGSLFTKEIIEENSNSLLEEPLIIDKKKKQHLIILTYMKRFLNQLLRRLSYKKLELVTVQHLQMVGDLSIPKSAYLSIVQSNLRKNSENLDILSRRRALYNDQETFQDQNCARKIMQMSKKSQFLYWLINQIPIIAPQSLFIILLEGLLLCILLFYLSFTPLKASFDFTFDEQSTFNLLAYKIPVFVFLLDIGVGFHTGYYELGRVVLSRKQIANNYLQKKFWIDSFCTLMMFLNTFVIFSTYLDIFNLILRINQMKMKIQKINEHFRIQNRNPALYELVKLTLILLFMSHLCGCGFHLIGMYSNSGFSFGKERNLEVAGYQQNWITYQGIDGSEWYIRYVFSIYFSIITMITVGFGDIFPVNIYEKIYVIGMTLVSCALFAYCVNAISALFSQMSQKSVNFKQKQYDLLSFMGQKNISALTQTKILKYLDYLEEESDQNTSKGELILTQFPQELKEQVMREYFVKILFQVPILRSNFSTSFLNAVSLKMKEKRLGPGEQLLSKSGHLETLQFITKGNIEYSMNDGEHSRSICQVQSDKTVIDFRLFITKQKSSVSISSSTMTNIAYISYADFVDELKKYQKDFVNMETFCYLRDQFLNDGRYEKICPSCNQYGHEIDDCPQVHYCVNRSVFSKRVFYSSVQKRNINPKPRFIEKKAPWLAEDVRSDLKYIRWAYIIEYHNLFYDVNIDDEIQVIESDKQFFMRCPKIRWNKIQQQASSQNQMNPKFANNSENGSEKSLSESDENSDFQTQFSDSFENFAKRNNKSNDTLNNGEKLTQTYNSQKEILSHGGWEEQNKSYSSIMNEFDVPPESVKAAVKTNDEQSFKFHNSNTNNNTNANTNNNGSVNYGASQQEPSIKGQESKKLIGGGGGGGQQGQQFARQVVTGTKWTSDLSEKELRKTMRNHSRRLTGRSLIGNQQALGEKTVHNFSLNQIQDRGANFPSNLSNPIGLSGVADQFNPNYIASALTNNNYINIQGGGGGGGGGGGMDSIRELDHLVSKLKKQYLSIIGRNRGLSSSDATPRGSQMKNNLFLNRINSNLSNTNTAMNVSQNHEIKGRVPKLAKARPSVRYQTVIHPQHHIFGKLQFTCDFMKEYEVYYPKGNATNIIKAYKKIQLFQNYFIAAKTIKGKQTMSEQFSSVLEQKPEKLNLQIQRILASKHAKHSQMSILDHK